MLKKLKAGLKDWGLFLITPVILFFVSHNMLTDLSLINEIKIFLNIVVLYMLTVFVSLLAGKAKTGIRILIALVWFINLANAYIFEFRGSYIMPWDIYSFGTAMGVAGNFSFVPTKRMIVGTVLFIIWFIVIGFCELDLRKVIKKVVLRISGAVTVLIGMIVFTLLLQTNSAVATFDIFNIQYAVAELITRNGLYVGFLYELKYLTVDKPEGYSKAAEKEILDNTAVDSSVSADTMPNIIVIMDEAFSDPAVNGKIETSEDYMPFIHSLQKDAENTQSGYLNMSVIGGNTANSEFEFLTGNSMAFLPPSSVAYQQFVRKKTDSLASYLGTMGYQSLAMHPYDSFGWNRPKVYPYFGFDEKYFLDGYFDQLDMTYVRKYVSDESFFKQIAKDVDKRAEAGPVFSFNVTMQNHASYGTQRDTLPWAVSVNGITEINKQSVRIMNYLNLMKLSDTALEELVNHYKESDKPTIIVFFGDHQPERKVFDVLWEQNGKRQDTLTEEEIYNTYKVPFIIWANYDIEEKSGLDISANYLGNLVLKAAGIPLTKYRTFIDKFYEQYPVISAVKTMDAEGNCADTEDMLGELKDYAKMQYYELFEDKDEYK